MEYIKKYFDTTENAEIFIQQINQILGIPSAPDATGRTYTIPQEDENGIYVEYDKNIEL